MEKMRTCKGKGRASKFHPIGSRQRGEPASSLTGNNSNHCASLCVLLLMEDEFGNLTNH